MSGEENPVPVEDLSNKDKGQRRLDRLGTLKNTATNISGRIRSFLRNTRELGTKNSSPSGASAGDLGASFVPASLEELDTISHPQQSQVDSSDIVVASNIPTTPEPADVDVEMSDGVKRCAAVLETLNLRAQAEGYKEGFPTTGLLSSDKRISSQIDFNQEQSYQTAECRLTPETAKNLIDNINSQNTGEWKVGKYTYRSVEGNTIDVADALVGSIEGVGVYIALDELNVEASIPDYQKEISDQNGKLVGYGSKPIKYTYETLSIKNSIKLEIPNQPNATTTAKKFEEAFLRLGLDNALTEPDEHDLQYRAKQAFMWQHKLVNEEEFNNFCQQHGIDPLKKLHCEEVAPGYFAYVEQGAHVRYEQLQDFFIEHNVYGINTLPQLLKMGILSGHERYRRGIFKKGSSSGLDFTTGGAESVFTRCRRDSDPGELESAWLLIDKNILDRTDWHGARGDSFGRLDPDRDTAAESSESFIEKMPGFNELMIRRGISPHSLLGVAVNDEQKRGELLKVCEKAGIVAVGSQPIADFIKVSLNAQAVSSELRARGLN